MPESFGRYLKREREMREISLEKISRQSKIKVAALVAIEEDRFQDLPPVAFVRGFVKSYAECIGLDPRDALLRLDHFLQENFSEKAAAPARSRQRLLAFPRLAWLALGFLAVVFFFAFQHPERWLKPKPGPSAPPALAVTPPSPQPAETISSQKKPAAAMPAFKLPEIRLHLEAADLCWVQYTLDHQPTQEAQLQRGQTLDLKAELSAQLLVGNAGGLRLQYNDQWLKSVGPAGRPVRLFFPPPTKKPAPPSPPPRPTP